MGQFLNASLPQSVSGALLRACLPRPARPPAAANHPRAATAPWMPGALRLSPADGKRVGNRAAAGPSTASQSAPHAANDAHGHSAQGAGVATALRVRRLAEAGQRADCAGRMVISGRMADVCAELERLAARA